LTNLPILHDHKQSHRPKIAYFVFHCVKNGSIDTFAIFENNGGEMLVVDHVYKKPKYKRNMNKADLVDRIASACGCTKADADRMMEKVVQEITSTLKGGEEVAIAGLGKFTAKMRAGRTGRNPRTGAPVQIPAMRVPKFSASKTLKDAVR
jgi:DNA-binding protein HU-beta